MLMSIARRWRSVHVPLLMLLALTLTITGCTPDSARTVDNATRNWVAPSAVNPNSETGTLQPGTRQLTKIIVTASKTRVNENATGNLSAFADWLEGTAGPDKQIIEELAAADVTWSSSDATIVQITDAATGQYTGLKAGTATLTGTYQSRADQVSVQVLKSLDDLKIIVDGKTTLTVGETTELQLEARYTDGTSEIVSADSWTHAGDSITTNTSRLAVIVTAAKVGTSTLTASYGGLEETIDITVEAAAAAVTRTVTSLTVTASNTKVDENNYGTLAATATYSDGSTEAVATTDVTWSSSDATIVQITNAATGQYKGLKVGTATLTGTYGGQSGSVAVEVIWN